MAKIYSTISVKTNKQSHLINGSSVNY
jgi:hypothetical protein